MSLHIIWHRFLTVPAHKDVLFSIDSIRLLKINAP